MGFVKLFKYASPQDVDKKAPAPMADGLVFHNLMIGKTADGVGWSGDKLHMDDVRIWFTDASSIIIGYAPDGCPAITFVPSGKK